MNYPKPIGDEGKLLFPWEKLKCVTPDCYIEFEIDDMMYNFIKDVPWESYQIIYEKGDMACSGLIKCYDTTYRICANSTGEYRRHMTLSSSEGLSCKNFISEFTFRIEFNDENV